jgi:hypothetical protein
MSLIDAARQALEPCNKSCAPGYCYCEPIIKPEIKGDNVKPPPEAQTEAEKIAYCAGWWAAMQRMREQAEPVAYLYHDAQSAHDANPLVHSTLLVMANERRPECRNETPLYTHPAASGSR